MIKIPQHIEHLLLHHDCVIVPGLGAFVAQNCSARYVEEEDMFLPPYRSVTFNPRLTDNDGLLTHHVAERNQLTYETAQKIVQEEVAEIRRKIQEKGQFAFSGIGTLCISESKYYDFKPIPCGIDAPALYGLDSYYVSPLSKKKEESSKIGFKKQDSDTLSFSLPMDFIRYAAAAAVAAVFYFVCIAPLNTAIQQERSEASMLRFLWSSIMPDTEQTLLTEPATITPKATHTDATSTPTESAEPTEVTKPAENTESPESASTQEQKDTPLKRPYTIVVASAISETNANIMVQEWQKDGLRDAEVLKRKSMVRVIYGHYSSEEEAQSELCKYRLNNPMFAEAWIYKIP